MSEQPARVGRYEIRRELGRGMMGVVYEAHDTMLDRIVALKTIQLGFQVSEADRGSFEQRFLTEARSAARLSHPGIVVVHDVGRDPDTGTFFMALEYLRGRPLSALYRQASPLDWRAALQIVAGVAEALHHAHAAGVVHRDVKPENIMVLDSGEPKVMDFGLAKLQKSQVSLTSSGQFFGTPLFMSPEQALGNPLDGRSDLFSLGAVAYALLTGRPPFTGENIPHIFLQVANEDPIPPSRANPAVPPAVDGIVLRAMAKDPAARYRNGQAMAQEIRDALAGNPPGPRSTVGASDASVPPPSSSVSAARPGPPGASRPAPVPLADRTRWPLGRVAAGFGVLAAGLLAGALLLSRGSDPGASAGAAGDAPSARAERPSRREAPTSADVPPVPTTLSAEDTRELARAEAARLAGDLEESRRILQDLLERDPEHTAAAELLERVEVQLWAREALPLEYRAEHNHRIGSCSGVLVFEEDAITYTSREHGLWRWGYDELEQMQRKNRRELELVTSEKDTLRLGGGKHYDFKLTRETLDADDWARLQLLARGG